MAEDLVVGHYNTHADVGEKKLDLSKLTVSVASSGKYPDADHELLKLQKAVKKLLPYFKDNRPAFIKMGAESVIQDIEKLLEV